MRHCGRQAVLDRLLQAFVAPLEALRQEPLTHDRIFQWLEITVRMHHERPNLARLLQHAALSGEPHARELVQGLFFGYEVGKYFAHRRCILLPSWEGREFSPKTTPKTGLAASLHGVSSPSLGLSRNPRRRGVLGGQVQPVSRGNSQLARFSKHLEIDSNRYALPGRLVYDLGYTDVDTFEH